MKALAATAIVCLVAGPAWAVWATAQTPSAQTLTPDDPDLLYRQRADPASARRAADLWAARTAADFEASWKLARACYWIGTHAPDAVRRVELGRGVNAGEAAVRLAANRPEGHFWLAADMGRLAESFGIVQGLKYRGRIKAELERVIAIEPGWQGGSAEGALGQWYFEVPRLFGGSRSKAEELLRRALTYDGSNRSALTSLADLLIDAGRSEQAAAVLRNVVDGPSDPEWIPEDAEFKKKAAERLQRLGR
jgi:hypothetical protein